MTVKTHEILEAAFAAHNVKAKYAMSLQGPTVIQHAFSLTSGTPLRKVTAMAKDLALAVGLDEVRIVAPIPGTSFVGIEVPNPERETVGYDDFATEPDWQAVMTGKPMSLPFPVGVDIGSNPIWADLTTLPHLLIAGTTGSGKSVALNSLVTSLIDHKSADELRLFLVDPKRVELGQFAKAPQVETVATNTADALDLLRDVVAIMDHRYEQFENAGFRNIGEYNAFAATDPRGAAGLPYVVVVVDELADLMMTSGKAVEPEIVRIAQLGRAAGVHLVLATQQPTVDVITGLIKANIASRWTFSVASSSASVVALGQPGAQALYGKGDSLWLPAGTNKPVRVQAVYTDDQTVARVVGDDVEKPTTITSPGAADDDDDLDLADFGVPVEDHTSCCRADASTARQANNKIREYEMPVFAGPIRLDPAEIVEFSKNEIANWSGELRGVEPNMVIVDEVAHLQSHRAPKPTLRERFGDAAIALGTVILVGLALVSVFDMLSR